MVMLVGYLDYISGVENSMLLLYLVPIALATSMRGIPAGIIVSVLSISAWVASDVFAGIVRVNIWNVLTGFGCYSLIVFLLARWRELLKQMHSQIEERTAALRRELAARKQLEAELAALAERERRGWQIDPACDQRLEIAAVKAGQACERRVADAAIGSAAIAAVIDFLRNKLEALAKIAVDSAFARHQRLAKP